MATSPPIVALVGRPNVGKSTLFNRLIGQRRAIVEDVPGVTRDRQYAMCEKLGHHFELVDTGGFVPTETEGMLSLMREQARIAIDEADAIIWVCDAREGVATADEEIGDVLRQSNKPVFCAVNKCDTATVEAAAMEFYALGVSEVYPIAAEHNRGVLDLMEALIEALVARDAFPEEQEVEDREPVRGGHVDRVRVSVVGRPNVGKSTLVNALLGDARMLASAEAGTTRDAIDVEFEHEGRQYTLIDTAGIRRRPRITGSIEQYAVSRAVRAIERSHVVLLVLDTTQEIAEQDARIAALVQRRGRACAIIANKWDLVEKDTKTMKAYEDDLREQLPFLAHAPILFVSALTGKRVHKVMELVDRAYAAFNLLIGTGQFNRWLERLEQRRQPPVYKNKRLKMYFGAQVSVRPPVFAIQVNNVKAVSQDWERFMKNRMREDFDLAGTPIRLRFKGKAARRSGSRPEKHAGQVEVATFMEVEEDGDLLEFDDALQAAALLVGDEDWDQGEGDEGDEQG